MESTHSIFAATVNKERESEQLLTIIREMSFELARKKVQRLKDEEHIQMRLGELFELFTKILETENLKNTKTVGAVIDGLVKAASFDKEEFLHKSIYEKEQLEKSISEQKKAIRNNIVGTFNILEMHIEKMEESLASDALQALRDAKLKGVEMLGILRETTSEALLTTLEKSTDIEDTVFEITKNLTYNAINEGDLIKNRFIDIANTVIEATIEIADENQSFAKEMINGAVHGTKEGMAKAIDKFKNDLKFAPEELDKVLEKDLDIIKKELLRIEESFVDMLENAKELSNGVSSQVISNIIENELNNSFAKIARVATEARELIGDKLDELKNSASGMENGFMEKAKKKFTSLKKDMNSLEEKAGKKFESMRNFEFENEKAKKAASEAKRLGNHAWEVAKGALKNAKESIKKDK
jgi:hypothetical protein